MLLADLYRQFRVRLITPHLAQYALRRNIWRNQQQGGDALKYAHVVQMLICNVVIFEGNLNLRRKFVVPGKESVISSQLSCCLHADF